MKKTCRSCSVYIALLVIPIILSINIRSAFIYFHWYLEKSNASVTKINPSTGTVTY